jgi:S1-C subfamily serine protease
MASVAALLLLAACSDDDSNDTSGDPPAQTVTENAGSTGTGPSSITEIVQDVSPSVVTVLAETSEGAGEGSGVVWDSDGRIVTNDHVAGDADSLRVVLASGERLDARLVARDPLTDLAVIEVDRTDLPAATFRDDLPQVGELAVAIGNPLGFESSATAGIVSGLHRSIPSGGQTPALVDLMQTDAPISPGNSGGALVDNRARIMGINVAYIPPEAQAVSIGFAIPSAIVTEVVKQLLETGQVNHSFLGIEPRPLTPEIASQLGISTTEGVLVFDVSEGSAAANAGLEPGDIIVDIDGKQIETVEDLYSVLRTKSPGDEVTIKAMRDGEEVTLNATLDARPT